MGEPAFAVQVARFGALGILEHTESRSGVTGDDVMESVARHLSTMGPLDTAVVQVFRPALGGEVAERLASDLAQSPADVCSGCGCTPNDACRQKRANADPVATCGWANAERTLCTACNDPGGRARWLSPRHDARVRSEAR